MYIRSLCIIDIQVYHGSKLIPLLFNSGRFLLIDQKLGFTFYLIWPPGGDQ